MCNSGWRQERVCRAQRPQPKSTLSRPQLATETARPAFEPAKTPAKCALFVRDRETSVRIGLRGGGCSLDRTRLHPPIPAIREINSVFCRLGPFAAIFASNWQADSMACSPIPYATEQRIFFTEQRISFTEQRIVSAEQKIAKLRLRPANTLMMSRHTPSWRQRGQSGTSRRRTRARGARCDRSPCGRFGVVQVRRDAPLVWRSSGPVRSACPVIPEVILSLRMGARSYPVIESRAAIGPRISDCVLDI
jgi:hypothetical protein